MQNSQSPFNTTHNQSITSVLVLLTLFYFISVKDFLIRIPVFQDVKLSFVGMVSNCLKDPSAFSFRIKRTKRNTVWSWRRKQHSPFLKVRKHSATDTSSQVGTLKPHVTLMGISNLLIYRLRTYSFYVTFVEYKHNTSRRRHHSNCSAIQNTRHNCGVLLCTYLYIYCIFLASVTR